MKKLLITQRLCTLVHIGETRECLDVRLSTLFADLGFLPIPVPTCITDLPTFIRELKPCGVVLSGGDDIGAFPSRDSLENCILDYSKIYDLPIFGICRGMQVINNFQGGTLSKIHGHVGSSHELRSDHTLYHGRFVNSYHSNAIRLTSLGKDLVPLAFSDDGTVEAMRHISKPWLSIMWHPERESIPDPSDLNIITSLLSS